MQESIFKTALRSLTKVFFSFLGFFLFLLILGIFIGNSAKFLRPSFSTMEEESFQTEILPDESGNTVFLSNSAPVLLRIDISGIIGGDFMRAEMIEAMLRISQKGSLSNGRIKGILLYINSPGGGVTDSDRIYHAFQQYKKIHQLPIFVYTSDLCASGGYYIACAGDKIYSSPTALVGSVGVKVTLNPNVSELLQKIGVQTVTLTEGIFKEKFPLLDPLPTNPKERAASYQDVEGFLHTLYLRFIQIVSENRGHLGLTQHRLEKELGAQVYGSSKAERLGYVDKGGVYYFDALRDLAHAAHIQDIPHQVIRLSCKKPLIAQLKRPILKMLLHKIGLQETSPPPFAYQWQHA